MGDFAPKLAQLTDDVLFGDVWARPGNPLSGALQASNQLPLSSLGWRSGLALVLLVTLGYGWMRQRARSPRRSAR